MTEKLFYTDAYLKEFTATVLDCVPVDGKYAVRLDRTAFFPEEGGQYADRGTLNGVAVLDVKERGGQIYHYTASPLDVGTSVEGSVDFERRYENMQCHTAEHILCGIIHRLFGYDNVGFHLGEDEVTFDISAPLTRAQLDLVEEEANRVVYANIPVEAFFPSVAELKGLTYRAKLDITEGVRLVRIGEVDTCACCAPHVAYTGEIGVIKCLDFASHKGGVRIVMLAGARAHRDYRHSYEREKRISALTSTPREELPAAVEKLVADLQGARARIAEIGLTVARSIAEGVEPTCGNAVALLPLEDIAALRALAAGMCERVQGVSVALCGVDGSYRFVMASGSLPLDKLVREATAALGGRGGGKADMVQGSFNATLAEINDYFK